MLVKATDFSYKSGNLMYSLMAIINSTVFIVYLKFSISVDLNCSYHRKGNCEERGVLVNSIVVILSQYTHISNIHFVYL